MNSLYIRIIVIAASIFLCASSNIVFSVIPIDSPGIIDQQGSYELVASITGSIIIQASNVTLNMNGNSIYKSAQDLEYGIAIMSGGYYITIANGFIDGIKGPGISNDPSLNCSGIFIRNVSINNCSDGINLQNCASVGLENCSATGNTNGYNLQTVSCLSADYCISEGNSMAGYALSGCSNCCFRNCKSLNTSSTANSFGYISSKGNNNLFESCSAEDVETTSTTSSVSAGFYFLNELLSSINNCTINNVHASGDATAFGILASSVMTDTSYGLTVLIDDFLESVAWSPDSKYLAVGAKNGYTTIYEVTSNNNQQLVLIQKSRFKNSHAVYSISWSSDGNYIALIYSQTGGGAQGYLNVYAFDGSITTFLASQVFNYEMTSCAWSPTGPFIAVCGFVPKGQQYNLMTQVYQWEPNNLIPYSNDTSSFTKGINGARYCVVWSPNGNYIAAGGFGHITNPQGDEYWSPDRFSLVFQKGDMSNENSTATSLMNTQPVGVGALAYRPIGQFLAVGGFRVQTVGTIFNPRDLAINLTNSEYWGEIVQSEDSDNEITSVTWSPSGIYLLVAEQQYPSANPIGLAILYTFDGKTISKLGSDYQSFFSASENVWAVAWAPSGKYIATAGQTTTGTETGQLVVYDLNFLYKPVNIQNNLMQNISGGNGSTGLKVNSLINFIANNISYANYAAFDYSLLNSTYIATEQYNPEIPQNAAY